MNDENKILMVLQGRPEEIKEWSVPSGGRESGESFEACCVREVWEETGYRVEIMERLHTKKSQNDGFEVQYFRVKIIGGAKRIQDPDDLIYDIRWMSAKEIQSLPLTYPEDREFLLKLVEENE